MQTIIDLWNGDIAPVERCGAFDREANLLALKMEHLQTKVEAAMTVEEKEVFQLFVRQTDAYYLRLMALAFREGFSLGSSLTAEAMT